MKNKLIEAFKNPNINIDLLFNEGVDLSELSIKDFEEILEHWINTGFVRDDEDGIKLIEEFKRLREKALHRSFFNSLPKV